MRFPNWTPWSATALGSDLLARLPLGRCGSPRSTPQAPPLQIRGGEGQTPSAHYLGGGACGSKAVLGGWGGGRPSAREQACVVMATKRPVLETQKGRKEKAREGHHGLGAGAGAGAWSPGKSWETPGNSHSRFPVAQGARAFASVCMRSCPR